MRKASRNIPALWEQLEKYATVGNRKRIENAYPVFLLLSEKFVK